jgi:hypothetical protein
LQEAVHFHHTGAAVNADLVLHGADVPGKISPSRAAGAASVDKPLVEQQIRIPAGGTKLHVELLNGSEERLEKVKAVHAEILEREGSLRVDRRQRTPA